MPTPTKGPRLGGGPAHEKLLIANLARALFSEGRIRTTEAKAKRLRPQAERLITFAKRGDVASRRQVLTVVRDKAGKITGVVLRDGDKKRTIPRIGPLVHAVTTPNPADPTPYAAGRMPVFIWMHGRGDDDSMYGFPMVDGHPGVKVATEQYRDDTDPDAMAVAVSPEETQAMFERHVRGRLPGLTPQCVHAAACLYTVSEDAGFVIDRHPSLEHVTVVSACSGHGFKHSAAIGEALARRLCGDDDGSLRAFTLDRFADV